MACSGTPSPSSIRLGAVVEPLRAGACISAISHLILPSIVLGTVPLAIVARMTRSAMLEVLGEDYVNKSIAGADDFTRTMAEWSTEFCWGALWTRPGLDRRTRSIVNLAMLGALGKPHELKLHVKGALKNGVTKDEIKEILLQVAVYCGVPAGIDAFRNAREAFNEVESK